MLPENRAFLIRGDDGQEYGPVDLNELREWVQENRAGVGTAVCLDEPGATWQTWQTYPELVALVAEVQGTTGLQTPAGTVPAPMTRRVLAFLLDFILIYFLAIPILGVVMKLYMPDYENMAWQVFFEPEKPVPPQFYHYVTILGCIFYPLFALYMAGFHAAHGRTPAKSILRIRVVDQNGQKPTLFKALLRGLGFLVSCYLYGIPFIYAFFDPQRRTAHDLIAGTYVVNE